MVLSKLLNGISFKILAGSPNIEVRSLEDNSKKCVAGSLFFAIRGTKENGEKYIEDAINRGAKVVVIENEEVAEKFGEAGVTILLVDSVRSVVGLIAKNFYAPNGYRFKLIGITGTNGKTSTSFMIGNALSKLSYNVAVVGTSGIFVNGKMLRGEALTTPDPIELQSLFGFLNSIYVDYVVMEVSAHALCLNKVGGVLFDYAIFSNLTEDHLDFFGDMENYGSAKAKLFLESVSKRAIINISDSFGESLVTFR